MATPEDPPPFPVGGYVAVYTDLSGNRKWALKTTGRTVTGTFTGTNEDLFLYLLDRVDAEWGRAAVSRVLIKGVKLPPDIDAHPLSYLLHRTGDPDVDTLVRSLSIQAKHELSAPIDTEVGLLAACDASINQAGDLGAWALVTSGGFCCNGLIGGSGDHHIGTTAVELCAIANTARLYKPTLQPVTITTDSSQAADIVRRIQDGMPHAAVVDKNPHVSIGALDTANAVLRGYRGPLEVQWIPRNSTPLHETADKLARDTLAGNRPPTRRFHRMKSKRMFEADPERVDVLTDAARTHGWEVTRSMSHMGGGFVRRIVMVQRAPYAIKIDWRTNGKGVKDKEIRFTTLIDDTSPLPVPEHLVPELLANPDTISDAGFRLRVWNGQM